MTRVFAVQQPTGRDPDTGAITPTMDLNPAREYGELRFILRSFENPFDNIQATTAEVQRVLDDEMQEDDWLLLVGNPALIGIVAAVAASLNDGHLRMLQWHRASRQYRPIVTHLPELDPPLHGA